LLFYGKMAINNLLHQSLVFKHRQTKTKSRFQRKFAAISNAAVASKVHFVDRTLRIFDAAFLLLSTVVLAAVAVPDSVTSNVLRSFSLDDLVIP